MAEEEKTANEEASAEEETPEEEEPTPRTIEELVELHLAEDAMSATLCLYAFEDGEEGSLYPEEEAWECLAALLEAQQIIFGVDDHYAKQIIAQWLEDGEAREEIIAIGEAAVDGEDAVVELLFLPPDKSKVVVNVAKGTALVHKTNPTDARSGRSVTDQEVLGKDGEDIEINYSDLVVAVEQEDGLRYEVVDDGMLKTMTDKTIEVVGELVIKEDVTYNMGPIEAWGSLEIRGAITPRSDLKVRNNLSVKGGIESSRIEVGGDLKSNGGIFGKVGESEIVVEGDLEALYVESSRLKVNGNVKIQDSIVSSTVHCEGSIDVTSRRGTILTSDLLAGGTIEAKVVGSSSEGLVCLSAGNHPSIWIRSKRMKRHLRNMSRKMMKSLINTTRMNSDRGKRLRQLFDAKRHRSQGILERMYLRRERVAAENMFEQGSIPSIRVRQQIYPNAQLRIGPFKYYVEHEARSQTYILDTSRNTVMPTS